MTNHAHVLVCVAERPDLRLREIADCVGVTERAVHRIISDLESDGYLSSRRVGRRNVYEIRCGARLRHALESGATIGELVSLFASERGSSSDVA